MRGYLRLSGAMAIAWLGVATLACNSTSSMGNRPSPASLTAVAAETGVAALVPAPNARSFEVTYRWTKGVPGNREGLFVWRQGNGLRRWDSTSHGRNNPTTGGTFTISSNITSDDIRGSSVTCFWFNNDDTPLVKIGCRGDDPLGIESAVRFVLASFVTDFRGVRMILGREAICYAAAGPAGDAQDTICLDSESGIPLYFDGADDENTAERIEAISVVEADPALSIPADLSFGDREVADFPSRPPVELQFPAVYRVK